jgi:hypothetical protein
MISVGVVVAVVVVLVPLVFWPEPKEPEYQGKKLSEWLEMQQVMPTKTAEAVRAIGTNAIPFLLRRFSVSNPKWQRAWRSPGEVALKMGMAKWGFVILGPEAKTAASDLTRVARETSDMTAYIDAVEALSYLGADAIKPLGEIALNPNVDRARRSSAIWVLGNMTYLGTNALPCIAMLAQCAAETNRFVSEGALMALTEFARTRGRPILGMNWTNAVPERSLRIAAVRVVGDFATNANEYVDKATSNSTNDPDPAVQAEVVRYLERRKDYLDSTANHK